MTTSTLAPMSYLEKLSDLHKVTLGLDGNSAILILIYLFPEFVFFVLIADHWNIVGCADKRGRLFFYGFADVFYGLLIV